jgi:hypothetical protein
MKCGEATMTSEQSSDHGEAMTWSLRDHHNLINFTVYTTTIFDVYELEYEMIMAEENRSSFQFTNIILADFKPEPITLFGFTLFRVLFWSNLVLIAAFTSAPPSFLVPSFRKTFFIIALGCFTPVFIALAAVTTITWTDFIEVAAPSPYTPVNTRAALSSLTQFGFVWLIGCFLWGIVVTCNLWFLLYARIKGNDEMGLTLEEADNNI